MAIKYRCVVSDVGFSDYILPISSFQMRLRHSPKQCYLSVVIPDVLTHASAIADRIDGDIAITMIDDLSEAELLEANINSFRTYLGGNQRAGEITGYKQITFSSPASISVPSAFYKSTDGSVTRYRIPMAQINPGDTVTISGAPFVPSEIYSAAGETQSVIEINN